MGQVLPLFPVVAAPQAHPPLEHAWGYNYLQLVAREVLVPKVEMRARPSPVKATIPKTGSRARQVD